MRYGQRVCRAHSVLLAAFFCALLSNSQLPVALAGNSGPPAGSPYDDSAQNATMTMFQVLSGENGQQYYMTNNKQAVMLPGAGVTTAGVCVYTAPDGSQWYVDRTGTQQSLPSSSGSGAMVNNGANNMAAGPYGSSDWETGSNYYQQQQYAAPPVAPPVQNNYYQNNNSNNSGGGGGGGLLSAVGAGLGAAAGAALSTVPWGTPVYWGGGNPWYRGAGGGATYVSHTSNSFNEWNHQNNNWNRTASNHWNNHSFSNNNWDHHWGQGSWPGKDHGFPAPHDQGNGRLYSGEGGNRGFGYGGGRFGGGGVDGGGRRDGGAGREGGGGADGGGRRDGGAGHRGDGGGSHRGGGDHAGGGGHGGHGGGGHGGGGHGRR